MNTKRTFIMCVSVLAVMLAVSAARAEDFSVNLKLLAEIDAAQALPEYKLDRVLTHTVAAHGDELAEKTFDVLIRFKDFGDVRLDQAGEAGPGTGKQWNGLAFSHGLATLADVKTGWIKNSPHLFIVAWVNEPDGRGNGHYYSHDYVIVQLTERHAHVLLRGNCSITAHLRGGIQEDILDYSRFTFDTQRSVLEEKLSRDYERASYQASNLGHHRKDDGGQDIFVATINETITLTHKLADGKLVPGPCRLVYQAQAGDELSQIARFYLGPLATETSLFEANADLAAEHKNAQPGDVIYLKKAMNITIPVPEKWLVDQFTHHLAEVRPTDEQPNKPAP